jgi:hypothetical protein
MEPVGDEDTRWASYSGDYRVQEWGVVNPMTPSARFSVDQGVPHLETSEQVTAGRETSTEIAPGRFLSETDETLDGPVPTWQNIELIKANGRAVWQLALGLTAAVAAWLLAAAARFPVAVVIGEGLRFDSERANALQALWPSSPPYSTWE